MGATQLLSEIRDTITVRRVFGEPIERDGATIIPVARVQGGGGGGKDTDQRDGAGFGVSARPAGVYVIRGGDVTWQAAVDINRIVLGGQLVAIALFLTVRSVVRSRRHDVD